MPDNMKCHDKTLTYVLITPARNEEAYIGNTISSVVSQTILPLRWIIVSDGSTDRTDDIVREYLPSYPWIELLRMPDQRDRQFAAKVRCFNAGHAKLGNIHYDIIGNLDADVSFNGRYFEFLIDQFRLDAALGVAGTHFVEDGYSSADDSFEGETHVAGGCQLFRRGCFEDIGGYVPHRSGGIDWMAVTTARMKGWKTRSFKEYFFYHHRSLGTAERNPIGSCFSYGLKDYYLGGHPLWEMFRITYQMTRKPYLVGGVALLVGYSYACLSRMHRPVSPNLMKFHRHEQMQKLRQILSNLMGLKSAG